MTKIRKVLMALIVLSQSCSSHQDSGTLEFSHVDYFDNGNVSRVYNIDSSGIMHGKYLQFYENGNVKFEGFSNHGLDTGIFTFYSEIDSGRIERIDEVIILDKNNNYLNRTETFDKMGNLVLSASSPIIEFEKIETDSSKISPGGLRISISNKLYPDTRIFLGSLNDVNIMTDTLAVLKMNASDFVFLDLSNAKVGKDTIEYVIINYEVVDSSNLVAKKIIGKFPYEIVPK